LALNAKNVDIFFPFQANSLSTTALDKVPILLYTFIVKVILDD